MKELNGRHYIGGEWVEGEGAEFESVNPATGEVVWRGKEASGGQVAAAVEAGRKALEDWEGMEIGERLEVMKRFVELLDGHKEEMARLISAEMGKPVWEALTEVAGSVGKLKISVEAQNVRCSEFIGGAAVTRYKAHGVVAVYGAFNFPLHLPNGHILPAFLAGNGVVFKPSEITAGVGELTVRLWEEAGLPKGVLNLVQGGRGVGETLAREGGVDGIFFTGSAKVGHLLQEMVLEQPHKILALEMGGNNPLVVGEVEDVEAAVVLAVQSAYVTSGQRCTCARRLIVEEGDVGDRFIERLAEVTGKIEVKAPGGDDEGYMGSLATAGAAEAVMAAQADWEKRGGKVLVRSEILKEGTGIVGPGLIDVTGVEGREDEEVFGPLLQVIRVKDFEAAVAEANNTRYGLAAGLISGSREQYEYFYKKIRAGVVNWNQMTTGASGLAPFGGVGVSGNHRPAGYFACDYCAYPVASIENEGLALPENLPKGVHL